MKIIGCGNPERGDDGAGIAVAERLLQLGIPAAAHSADALSLLDCWQSGEDEVILIDAVSTGSPAGTLHVWENELPALAAAGTFSSHGFDTGRALALARILRRLPVRLRVYAIEASHFRQGDCMSPEVSRAVDLAAGQIRAEFLEVERAAAATDQRYALANSNS
jgi:hydrogenase maturation protease